MLEPCGWANTSLPTPFPQQWFKIGGSGPKTNQLSALLDFTYFFKSGWSHWDRAKHFAELAGSQRSARNVTRRAAGGKDVQMRAHTDLVSAAVAILPAPSNNLRSEVEHSAADNPDDTRLDKGKDILTLRLLVNRESNRNRVVGVSKRIKDADTLPRKPTPLHAM